jgi:hypothetical protein
MTIYTLIAHKPDGVDTCRGCVMDRWSGQFDRGFTDDIEDIKKEILRYYKMNKDDLDRFEPSWDVYIYIDGIPVAELNDGDFNKAWDAWDTIEEKQEFFMEFIRKAIHQFDEDRTIARLKAEEAKAFQDAIKKKELEAANLQKKKELYESLKKEFEN